MALTTCKDIVDIKPPNMEDLTEVITAAQFHPSNCNEFIYSSSKGSIRLCDMREKALCDEHAKRESSTLVITGPGMVSVNGGCVVAMVFGSAVSLVCGSLFNEALIEILLPSCSYYLLMFRGSFVVLENCLGTSVAVGIDILPLTIVGVINVTARPGLQYGVRQHTTFCPVYKELVAQLQE